MSLIKYEKIVDRLVAKMKLSQTPVPGFIMGLSGTDSIIAFKVVYDAAKRLGLEVYVAGVHYVNNIDKITWFERDVFPWLTTECQGAQIFTTVPRGGNRDPQRYADLHLRANNIVSATDDTIIPWDEHNNYWTCGTMNATEKALGKYSLLSTAVSVQPIQSLWKSEVMALCHDLGVPEEAIRRSRLPDCLCGRDEFAAENIEQIDTIMTHGKFGALSDWEPAYVDKAIDYVRSEKQRNGFRERIPYLV